MIAPPANRTGPSLRQHQQMRIFWWRVFNLVAATALVIFYCWWRRFPDFLWLGRDKEFWYEAAYLAFVLGMGIPVLVKWRHSRLFVVRTLVVMGIQAFMGFLLVYFILPLSWRGVSLDGHFYPLTAFAQNFWPLEIYGLIIQKYFGFPPVVIGWFSYTILTSLILMPIIALRYGRAYCSWFCACGNLAETFGDPWRTQAPKGRAATWWEWSILPFVLYAIFATVALLLNWGAQTPLQLSPLSQSLLTSITGEQLSTWQDVWGVTWDWLVKFFFASVLGIGLYPLLGGRIWCRYFCPWAGLFGALGRLLGKSAIVANNMCMGCGLCNTNCEMGIDIRSNALHGQDTKTTSCVYCGACVAICPRHVLRLK